MKKILLGLLAGCAIAPAFQGRPGVEFVVKVRRNGREGHRAERQPFRQPRRERTGRCGERRQPICGRAHTDVRERIAEELLV